MNRGLKYSFACLTAATLLAGCGGGGSSPKTRGNGVLSLTFVADAGSAAGPVGTSHKIVIYRTDGSVLDTKIVDTSAGTAQLSLSNLPSGTLRLHVGLSAVAGGTEIGSVDTTFQGGSAPAPMQFAMRKTVTKASLTPLTPTVSVGGTAQLYATGKDADGNFVYTAPTDWTWTSETPGFASVDANGLVTGAAEGATAVTATHTTSGKAASTNVGVLSNTPRRGKWTVMVYVNAANNLWREAIDNVNQMERIANNPDVRFVIQWKQVRGVPSDNTNPDFSGTRRYLATYDSMSLTNVNQSIKSTVVQDLGAGVDMGASNTLAGFVSWAKGRFPADHYALVMWDHGSGWYSPGTRLMSPRPRAISIDEETDNYLTTPDLRNAMAGQTVDIFAYDACLMQGAENLIELADKADYIIGSSENTPGPGYPYHTVFKPFVDTPDAAVPTLTRSFVTAFHDWYRNDSYWSRQPLHQSVLDTSKIAPFQLALTDLANTLNNTSGVGATVQAARSASKRIAPTDGYSYYDLDQLCEKIAGLTSDTSLAAKATALRGKLADMVVLSQTNTAGAHMKGLSIDFARSVTFNGSYGAHYGALRISALTPWDDFLANTVANP